VVAISCPFIGVFWWLLMAILLMAIGVYFINGYWWLFLVYLG
jgi:hypothetical protein